MKEMLIGIGGIIAILVMAALLKYFVVDKKQSLNAVTTNNGNIKVELLFEHDGVKVYRFYDNRTVYYTDARGKTEWEINNGKTTSKASVDTVE